MFNLNPKNKISIDDVYNVAVEKKKITITDWDLVDKGRKYLEKTLTDPNRINYGINTGFGALSQKIIPHQKLRQLQVNLVRSHCTGVGEPFKPEIVRASMFLRLYCLTHGYSAVRRDVITQLVDFLNHDIIPFVPSQGSVGASGDLAPLAHIALCLIGEGEVYFENQLQPTEDVFKKLKIKPLVLEAKEGLALINGTSVLTALGALALRDSMVLADWADAIAALSVDALQGSIKPFHQLIHSLKPHPGQLKVAKTLTTLLENSQILNNHTNCSRVQDPYSLRCIPQVHGAIRQTIEHAKEVLEIEINAITDNPLIFTNEDLILSGGNFHGEAAAMAMDYLAIGLTELANISERRIEKMMNPAFSGLPAFLTSDSGLNSGLMIAQVTAAALASENKVYAHPASIDNIPTSTDKEDHVSMGVTAGVKLNRVVANTRYVLCIELLCNTQALEFLRPFKSSPPLEKIYTLVRKSVPSIQQDRAIHHDLKKLNQILSHSWLNI